MTTLAVDGGAPVRSEPLPPWPHFEAEEIEAATAVLRSGKVNYWTGEEGRLFEKEFADLCGCEYGVAVANGTVALELALRALGISEGDEVIVTSRTFIASASCAVMCGATPVMADVDPVSQNTTAETIEAALTPRTKAIIAVHLAGWPCDMDPIMEFARRRGLRVIEDCAQALGALYREKPVGSLGDAAAFSFCQDKIMTTGGEGGMLVTSQADIWERAWSIKDHGKNYHTVYHQEHPPGFRWLHESLGTNWRLTEMQSAMGRAGLKKVPGWIDARRANVSLLTDRFSEQPALRLTIPPEDVHHAYYRYYCFVRPEALNVGWNRDRIMTAVSAEGVPCFSGSCSEIYLEKAFDEKVRPPRNLPVAKELGETSLAFLVHPTLTAEDTRDVCRAVDKVMHVATKT